MTSIPTNPKAAHEGGFKFYIGKPCEQGHGAVRYESSRRCVECARIQSSSRELTEDQKRAYAERRKSTAATKRSKEKRNKRQVEARKANPVVAFAHTARTNVNRAFARKGMKKDAKTELLLGCSIAEFRLHIERQFLPGMSWVNRSKWHIDHIVALSNATTHEEVAALCHHTNLRPMWAKENQSKSDSVTHLI